MTFYPGDRVRVDGYIGTVVSKMDGTTDLYAVDMDFWGIRNYHGETMELA